MQKEIVRYDTDLTGAQWDLLEPHLPKASRRGRPRTPLRTVVDAILHVVRSGCQWRLLPRSYPPWKTVHHVFVRWMAGKTWEALNAVLRACARADAGKKSRPTAAILDSQTVRSGAHGGSVGYDAAKKTKGRKRFLLVDTLGLVLGAEVFPANTPERAGARGLLGPLLPWFRSLRKLWVDGGFSGPDFAAWVREQRPRLAVEVVKRSDDPKGFEVLPRRWVVERTFGWLMLNRRLVRDHEKTGSSATAWIYVAMIRLMLNRLA